MKKYLFRDLSDTAKKVAIYNYYTGCLEVEDDYYDCERIQFSECRGLCEDVDEDTISGLCEVYYQENGEDYE